MLWKCFKINKVLLSLLIWRKVLKIGRRFFIFEMMLCLFIFVSDGDGFGLGIVMGCEVLKCKGEVVCIIGVWKVGSVELGS